MRRRAAQIAAALALAALGFMWGVRTGAASSGRPAPEEYDPAELTWVAEGLMEEISELEDELARVQAMMEQG